MLRKSKYVPEDLVSSLKEALKSCSNAMLLPSLSNKEIEQLELFIGKFPNEFKELLKFTRGIEFKDSHSIRFDTPISGNGNLFPRSLLLGTDDYGDYATLEFGAIKDSIGPVIYFCHDPSHLIISSKTLAEFFVKVIPDALRSEDRPFLSLRVENKLFAKSSDSLNPASFKREIGSNAHQFASWKSKLPASAKIFDLSEAKTGDGFDWAAFGPDTSLARFKNELAFAAFPERESSRKTLKVNAQENLRAIGSISDIKFPCIWFRGPYKSSRTKYGYGVIAGKWFIRFTPFWPALERYLPSGMLDSDGKLYEFKALVGWSASPKLLPDYLSGLAFCLRRIFVKFDVLTEAPVILNKVEFKEKVIEMTIGINQYNASRSNNSILAIQKLKAAKEYSELIEWVDWYQKTDGGSVL